MHSNPPSDHISRHTSMSCCKLSCAMHSYASGLVFRTDGAQGVGIVNAMRGASVAIVSHLCFCSPSKPLQCLTPLSAASAAVVTAGGIIWVRSAGPVQVCASSLEQPEYQRFTKACLQLFYAREVFHQFVCMKLHRCPCKLKGRQPATTCCIFDVLPAERGKEGTMTICQAAYAWPGALPSSQRISSSNNAAIVRWSQLCRIWCSGQDFNVISDKAARP